MRDFGTYRIQVVTGRHTGTHYYSYSQMAHADVMRGSRKLCQRGATLTTPWKVREAYCFPLASVRVSVCLSVTKSCPLFYLITVMPRSHIHGSPQRFYYGLNLTGDPGNANFHTDALIRMNKYCYV